jgi:hypothetical protein
MEMILGVIEDLLDRVEQGAGEDQEDAKQELKLNLTQFQTNLQQLASSGNADADAILKRLEKVKGTIG